MSECPNALLPAPNLAEGIGFNALPGSEPDQLPPQREVRGADTGDGGEILAEPRGGVAKSPVQAEGLAARRRRSRIARARLRLAAKRWAAPPDPVR